MANHSCPNVAEGAQVPSRLELSESDLEGKEKRRFWVMMETSITALSAVVLVMWFAVM
jgi:hypothetical protein